MRLQTALALAAVLSVPVQAADAAQDRVAVKAKRIVTGTGETIENGVILIEDGRIAAVGADLEAPWDAVVHEADTVYPGLVEAHNSRGLDTANENVPVTPFISVLDAVDPSSFFFEDSRRDGVTTMLVIQGNNTVVGGTGMIVRPAGLTVEDMTVRPVAGMKISVSPKSGFTRMTQMAELRKAFRTLAYELEVAANEKEKEAMEKGEKEAEAVESADLDVKWRALNDLSKGKMDAFVYCGSAMDVQNGIDIATDNGFLARTTFVLGAECFKAVDALKASGRPVVLSSALTYSERDPITEEVTETFVPSVFHDAGVPFALARGSSTRGDGYLWFQAGRCIAEGISEADALAAITTAPAAMLGLGDRIGTIEAGKDANLLLMTGSLLEATTWVEKTLIEGKVAYDRTDDARLKRVLEGGE